MKILVLVDREPHSMLNPYIYTLMDSINQQFDDIEWGYSIDIFWSDECYKFDIIHIHWPQIFLKYRNKKINIEKLRQRFKELKNKNIKIVSTCHNLAPHYNKNELCNQLYTIVYNESDYIFHLGNFSLNLFQQKYPTQHHILLPHHIYDTVYTNRPSKEESMKALKLKDNCTYILCFGEFRANEERELIIKLAQYAYKENFKLLAPSFCLIPKRRNLVIAFLKLLKYIFYKLKYGKYIIFEKKPTNNEKLLYYYGASDISLIHRLHILNSGNVTLGFLMKNVVVGPNIGNVGEILRATANPTFDPSDTNNTLLQAIKEAIKAKQSNRGIHNYEYAIKELSTNNIANKLYHFYKQIIKGKLN